MTDKAAEKREEQTRAIQALRDRLQPGDRVYTVLRQVSRSGMSRHISVVVPYKDQAAIEDITWYVAQAGGYRRNEDDGGLVVTGCGMDMGFSVVYSLGRTLFPDGFGISNGAFRPSTKAEAETAVSMAGLAFYGRNGDRSGWDNDGGYALKQEWL